MNHINEETEKHYEESTFAEAYDRMQQRAHMIALAHGWWDSNRSNLECLALIASEVGEAIEACRKDPLPTSDHLPYFTGIEEELADIIIRIMDLSQRRNWNVSGALIAKMDFNAQREYKHGKAL